MRSPAPPPSRRQLREEGRALRAHHPRSALAAHASGTRDPLGIFERQNENRLPELLSLRRERTAQNPFTFYRGTAALMAADLADAPNSGILVASCGDAHVSNFGFYASPQRDLVFDLNDFDEAAWAPWEWDLKRLVTSVIIGGRSSSREERTIEDAARLTVARYLDTIRAVTRRSPVERYFTRFDIDAAPATLDPASREALTAAVAQAQKRTGKRAVRKLTERDARGRRRIVLREPTTLAAPEEARALVQRLFDDYLMAVPADVALLFRHFAPVDVALRVVGVGSVGTRCFLVLMQDGDDHALLMQPKQASRSVLEEYGRVVQPAELQTLVAASGEGARVVAMQRILQALSDPFLGHVRSETADYYVRQFHDMKGGFDVEGLENESFLVYARGCATVLARAHSQSDSAARITGYVGGGRQVTEAILDWCYRYVDVSARDHAEFVAAHTAR